MAMRAPAGTSKTEKALGKSGETIDNRYGLARFGSSVIRKVFPDHWSFLLGEIALQRLSWMTLAPVPHDRRQERQVRRRQRAPIHRRAGEGGFRAAVRVVDVRDLEVRTRFDRNRNADQPFVEEQAVRGESGFDARHVRRGQAMDLGVEADERLDELEHQIPARAREFAPSAN